jgi:DNA transformation protein and related proteins
MAATPAYLEFLIEHLAPLGAITQRRMFGGHCLYCNGTVFALVAGNDLYLKADAESLGVFVERKLKQFSPFDDPKTTMNYFQPPPEFFDDADALKLWGKLAVDAGVRGAKPKKGLKRTAAKKASKKSVAKRAPARARNKG